MKSQATDDVISYLEWLGDEYGESYATRFTRKTTGLGIREKEEVIELPSYFTKRSLYVDFCFRQGWVVPSVSQKGNYGPINAYRPRSDDDWDSSVQPQIVCDWKGFRSIWNEKLPLIRIRPKAEDTCTECYVFKQRMKFRDFLENTTDQTGDNDSLSSSSNIENDYGDGTYKYEKMETQIQRAYVHVEAAQVMRETINNRMLEAQATIGKLHGERNFCFIMDYAQNLELPHLGEEQPGDIYYYSPKSVYVFGIANVNVVPNIMNAYSYVEEYGRKGGNNVASLLMMFLMENNVLQYDNQKKAVEGNRLTIAADNCGGQNKNNMVL